MEYVQISHWIASFSVEFTPTNITSSPTMGFASVLWHQQAPISWENIPFMCCNLKIVPRQSLRQEWNLFMCILLPSDDHSILPVTSSINIVVLIFSSIFRVIYGNKAIIIIITIIVTKFSRKILFPSPLNIEGILNIPLPFHLRLAPWPSGELPGLPPLTGTELLIPLILCSSSSVEQLLDSLAFQHADTIWNFVPLNLWSCRPALWVVPPVIR